MTRSSNCDAPDPSDTNAPKGDARVTLKRGDRIVLASHNPGKLVEFEDLLAPYGVEVLSASALALPEPEETGTTFAENAILKARAAAQAMGLIALADDSGLEVADLGGAPGVYSARWGGPAKDFAAAMQRVHDEVVAARNGWPTPASPSPSHLDHPDGASAAHAHSHGAAIANFNATLALAHPDGTIAVFEGKVFGQLVWPPRGENGFGYDPMFQPDGHTKTFGEMTRAEKHGHTDGRPDQPSLSHRARALDAFIAATLVSPRHDT